MSSRRGKGFRLVTQALLRLKNVCVEALQYVDIRFVFSRYFQHAGMVADRSGHSLLFLVRYMQCFFCFFL